MSIHHHADVTDGARQVMHCSVRIDGPFSSKQVVLSFPRWTPGSYLVREPLRLVHDMRAASQTDAGVAELDAQRRGPCEISIRVPEGCSAIDLYWSQFAHDLSVRTNHLDSTHVHMMPSATWPKVVTGIENPDARKLTVSMTHPEVWTASSQMPETENEPIPIDFLGPLRKGCARSHWSPADQDALYDGIIEANANPVRSFFAGGRTFHLKAWDAADLPISQEGVDRLIEASTLIIEESHALFGAPPWDDYTIILHLTGAVRGGLEHSGSQTSAVRRTSLDRGDVTGWRDLISLIAHEYMHAWNVKRLRPKEFLDYDLSEQRHTDLLWWFEGVTSWLGDLICVRSGAWSEQDWVIDLTRKIKRHRNMSGNDHQSLAESSHEAWIHLYRPHCFSNETTISYYLQGELAAMCLDLSIRRRTKGESGLDDVMLDLWKRHGGLIEGDNPEAGGAPLPDARPGIDYEDIRKSVNRVSNGRLGSEMQRLFRIATRPPIDDWAKGNGKRFVEESERDGSTSVLGCKMSLKGEKVIVDGFLPDSPARDRVQAGDEVISIAGRRITDLNGLKHSLRGRSGLDTEVLLARRGGIVATTITPVDPPFLPVKLVGRGNAMWASLMRSRAG